MRYGAARLGRAACSVLGVCLLLAAGFRFVFEEPSSLQRLKSAGSSSRAQELFADGSPCGGTLGSLSIVCLTDSPLSAEWTRPVAGLATLKSAPDHVVLAGHSRLRQVFEQLTPLLPAPLRTRADRLPPLADQEPSSAPLLPANSSCLAAFPKPHAGQYWCSMAADWGRLLIDFRWQSQTAPLSALVARLSARPPRLLLLCHGLYQALDAGGGLLRLRGRLALLLNLLQRLQDSGTTVAWLLEAGMNPETRLRISADNRHVLAVNALLTETLLKARVAVWSAHLPLVSRWVTGDCRHQQTVSEDSRRTCERELLHTDAHTNRLMAQQLIGALIAGS